MGNLQIVWCKAGLNKRTNRILDTPWGPMTLMETAKKLGIRHATLRERIERGWPPERVFAVGRQPKRRPPE